MMAHLQELALRGRSRLQVHLTLGALAIPLECLQHTQEGQAYCCRSVHKTNHA